MRRGLRHVLCVFVLLTLLESLSPAIGPAEAEAPHRVIPVPTAPEMMSGQPQGGTSLTETPLTSNWVVEPVDVGKQFDRMGDRSLVLDSL